jgi:hypothetical protein
MFSAAARQIADFPALPGAIFVPIAAVTRATPGLLIL